MSDDNELECPDCGEVESACECNLCKACGSGDIGVGDLGRYCRDCGHVKNL